MSNKAWEAMKIALHGINSNERSIVLVSDEELLGNGMTPYVLNYDFSIKDVLSVIGDTKVVGILDSDMMNEASITELVNILTNKNKATVVRLNARPISCKIFYPVPEIGTNYRYGNYEYSYGQVCEYDKWTIHGVSDGWGVRVINNSQINYESPLTMIYGHPVTNMSYLFHKHPTDIINLIDWDTSNVTSMRYMFVGIKGDLDLSKFNTSKVTDMEGMFSYIKTATLDLRSFDTSNVTNMSRMFEASKATSLDLSSFNTSKVNDMNCMFASCHAISLDLSKFNTSLVSDMHGMFDSSKAISLDLSSFDTWMVLDMDSMFCDSQATSINLTVSKHGE